MGAVLHDIVGDDAQIDQGSDWLYTLFLEDVQRIATLLGAPGVGTFRLGWQGPSLSSWSDTIPYNAAGAAVQTILEKHPGVGPGNVVATGAAAGPWTITLSQRLRAQYGDPDLVADYSGLAAAGGAINIRRRPWNLTGYTARMKIRQTVGAADPPLATLTSVAAGGIVIGAAAGTVDLSLSATATTALNFTSPGVYDLELLDAASRIVAVIYGSIGLRKEVTT